MCDLDTTGVPSIFKVILSDTGVERMLSTFDLNCEENTARLLKTHCDGFSHSNSHTNFDDELVLLLFIMNR